MGACGCRSLCVAWRVAFVRSRPLADLPLSRAPVCVLMFVLLHAFACIHFAFAAAGDNSTDNTAAFTAALNAAAGVGGATVLVPAGMYVFQGSLSIPSAVNLKGSYEVVPSHQMVPNLPPPNDGSILLPLGGQGNVNATPFITVNSDSTLAGFVVWYPTQQRTGTP